MQGNLCYARNVSLILLKFTVNCFESMICFSVLRRYEILRLRYHNMSAEERRNFNARRAKALRTARMRDDELCRMAERAQMSGTTLDADLMIQVCSLF